MAIKVISRCQYDIRNVLIGHVSTRVYNGAFPCVFTYKKDINVGESIMRVES